MRISYFFLMVMFLMVVIAWGLDITPDQILFAIFGR